MYIQQVSREINKVFQKLFYWKISNRKIFRFETFYIDFSICTGNCQLWVCLFVWEKRGKLIFILVMPKYEGVSPKWVKSKRRKRKRERAKVGNINGQLRIANTTLVGARKPPGPIIKILLHPTKLNRSWSVVKLELYLKLVC